MKTHPESSHEAWRVFRVALTASAVAWLAATLAVVAAEWYVGDLPEGLLPKCVSVSLCFFFFFAPIPLLHYPWHRPRTRETAEVRDADRERD